MVILRSMVHKKIELEDINQAILNVALAIESLSIKVEKKFEQIDERFKQIDVRFSYMDARFDALDARLNSIENEQRLMRLSIENIDGRLMGVENDIYEIYDQLAKQKSTI